MDNLFKDKTNEELKVLFKQYLQFQKTGIIPDNELGKITDELYEKIDSRWRIIMMEYLLEAIGNRWLDEA